MIFNFLSIVSCYFHHRVFIIREYVYFSHFVRDMKNAMFSVWKRLYQMSIKHKSKIGHLVWKKIFQGIEHASKLKIKTRCLFYLSHVLDFKEIQKHHLMLLLCSDPVMLSIAWQCAYWKGHTQRWLNILFIQPKRATVTTCIMVSWFAFTKIMWVCVLKKSRQNQDFYAQKSN